MRFQSFVARLLGAVVALLLCAGPVAAVPITIVEFYNTTLRHYVLITNPDEVRAIERGDAGPGWQRTGGTLLAYSTSTDAPNLVPVCRFYGNVAAGGPNSHFFTAEPAECEAVKRDPGWRYEGIAFYVSLPVNNQCPAAQRPVWRAYNNGFAPQLGINDGNHRFSTDRSTILALVAQGWRDEGVVFCVPGGTAPGTTSANCMIPIPGFSGDYRISSKPSATYRIGTSGSAGAPVATVTLTADGVTTITTTPYQVTANPNGGRRLARNSFHTEVTGPGVTLVEDVAYPEVLDLPMQPGAMQSMSGAVSGTYSITIPGYSCTGPLTGTQQTAYTFVGVEPVTVPAGTFSACRFNYDRTINLTTTCGEGFGAGGSTDHITMWVIDGLGPVKTLDNADGSLTELLSYTH